MKSIFISYDDDNNNDDVDADVYYDYHDMKMFLMLI